MLDPETTWSAGNMSAHEIVAEANHRIANSLSIVTGLVRLQLAGLGATRRSLDVDEVCWLLEEVKDRIDSVARLHRMMSRVPPGGAVDLENYLRGIVDELGSSLFAEAKLRIDYRFDHRPQLAPERALYAGLIVGELVTNALKYAHPAGSPGVLTLSCTAGADGGTTLLVADDGVGLPEAHEPGENGHLGLSLARSLAARLGGSLQLVDTGLGLTCVLRLPSAG